MERSRRALELLRKRYRLPISLLLQDTAPGSPLWTKGFVESVDEDGVLEIKAMITCVGDAKLLINRCTARGIGRLFISFSDFTPPVSVQLVENMIARHEKDSAAPGGAPAPLDICVINRSVAKEKNRLCSKLELILMRLRNAVDQLEEGIDSPEQRGPFEENLNELKADLEEATLRKDSTKEAREEFLDCLIHLEIGEQASPEARKEGIWLLKHCRPEDYIDNDPEQTLARCRLEIRLANRCNDPSATTLAEARKNVLGAFGRHHLESALAERIGLATAAIDQLIKGETTTNDALKVLNEQIQAVWRLAKKRSLIGCVFIDFDDLPFNSGSSQNGSGTGSDDRSGSSSGNGSVSAMSEEDDEEDDVDMSDVESDENLEEEDEDFEEAEVEEEEEEEDEEEDQMSPPKTPDTSEKKEVPEESPISATSFLSTNSEIGEIEDI